jgi:hypothetical protein
VVGLGEEVFGQVNFNLASNQRSFFLLRMKLASKGTRFPGSRPPSPPPTDMFFPVTVYVKEPSQ